MRDAGECELVVEYPEDRILVEVQRIDVLAERVVAPRGAEAEPAILVAEPDEVRGERRPVSTDRRFTGTVTGCVKRSSERLVRRLHRRGDLRLAVRRRDEPAS